MIILGVDPGAPGRTGAVGLVVADRERLLAWRVVHDPRRPGAAPDLGWLDRTLAALDDIAGEASTMEGQVGVVAVEQVVRPSLSGERRLIAPDWLLVTAAVAGAAAAWARFHALPCVEVAPGGHGQQPAAAYPAPLRTGPRTLERHCRSAWDIAMSARPGSGFAGAHFWGTS